MKIVDMHEATTTLSRLVERAAQGEEILIARDGKPVAKIVALRNAAQRFLGQWRGRVRMSDDFDAPLPEEEQHRWAGK